MTSILDTDNALTSWATVQDYGGIPEDNRAYAEGLINGASWMLNSMTNRKLLARALTEYYDGDGTNTLLLRNPPLNLVTNLYDDPAREWGTDTIVSTDNYVTYEAQGKIVATETSFSVGAKVIKIVYNGGYATVPYDLAMGCIELVCYWYDRYKNKRYGIKSISTEARNITYMQDIPSTVRELTDLYRKAWIL